MALLWARLVGAALILIAETFPAQAQIFQDRWLPRCGGSFGLCGYVKRDGGETVLPFRFEVAQPFSEELAAVRVDGKFGYIDRRGKLVIPPRFTAAAEFRNGFAEVRLSAASGVIDRVGRLVVPAKFERILPLANGAFVAQPLDNRRRVQAVPRLSSAILLDFRLYPEHSSGLYHRRRGWLTPQDFSFAEFDKDPRRGLIWASRRSENGDDNWGLLQSNGKWRVTPRYWHVQPIMDDRAIVCTKTVATSSGRTCGAVDPDGRLVVPLRYSHLSYWRGGYGTATDGTPNYGNAGPKPKKGLVRRDGELLGGRYFDDVEINEYGRLPRVRLGDMWYSVKSDGQLVSDRGDGSVLLRCPGGLILLRRGDKIEFRHTGRATPIGVFDNTYQSQRDCSATMSVRAEGLWSFVTQDGRHLGGQGFTKTYSFGGGYAVVQVNGLWGIINEQGAFTVTPTYREIQGYRGAYKAKGWLGERLINGEGQTLESPPIPEPDPRRLLQCEGGLALFDKGGLWGIRDASGKVVVRPKHRAISCFRNGVAWIPKLDRKAWCAIGPDGADRPELACQQQFYAVRMSELFPEPYSDDPFESSILWNRAYLDYASGRRPDAPRWISNSAPSSGWGGILDRPRLIHDMVDSWKWYLGVTGLALITAIGSAVLRRNRPWHV